MVDALEALDRLKQGNARFVRGELAVEQPAGPAPFAIILSCPDARVSPEILFDQGLGDLCVLRVPGNAVAPIQIAEVEHAAEGLGCRLVVVLGHSGCAAVRSTLDELRQPGDDPSVELGVVFDHIAPAVEELLASGVRDDEQALMAAAVEANMLASVEHLLHGSDTIESLAASAGLLLLGAHYCQETGKVSFFE